MTKTPVPEGAKLRPIDARRGCTLMRADGSGILFPAMISWVMGDVAMRRNGRGSGESQVEVKSVPPPEVDGQPYWQAASLPRRPPIGDPACTEEVLLRDLHAYYQAVEGVGGVGERSSKKSGSYEQFCASLPTLNGQKLDVYNLYREVVTRGGGDEKVNWKGEVFVSLRNFTDSNKQTGISSALKGHYKKILGGYEECHPMDRFAGRCQFCVEVRGEADTDWVVCSGPCWKGGHYSCDPREELEYFATYKKEGVEYTCGRCLR